MRNLIFASLLQILIFLAGNVICYSHPASDSTSVFQGTKTIWKGFVRYDFNFNGRQCRIVCPDKPASGNPWIWNARFPDWHTDIDSILLSNGFYVTYINTDEFNGSPDGVKIWDEYFTFLTTKYRLENVVALEGISRGGLYVYNFAKKYPWRISCIYCEAPVCDIKSWPGGFGKGKGSSADWQLVMKTYNFRNEDEARTFRNNPVDSLDALASSGVPILHMIGLNDEIVPPEENTFILVNRYIRLGGKAVVVPCIHGRQELNGHHFDIETPEYVASFVKENTKAFRKKLTTDNFYEIRGGLKYSAGVFIKEKKGRVAFLGGSITYNPGWRDSVCNYLRKRFPETTFEFINAGIPSLGSVPDAFRVREDVLSKGKIDLLFVEAAVNDRTNGYPGNEQVRAMEGIVRQVKKANPYSDIVFLFFADEDKINDYNRGIIPEEISNHEKIASAYNIPDINLAREVTMRINNREFTWKGDFLDVHPSPFGQHIYYSSISRLLDKCWDKKQTVRLETDNLSSTVDPFCYDKGKLIEVNKNDESDGWRFIEKWVPDDNVSTREGFTNVPVLVGNQPGKIMKFRFTGSAIGIAVVSGPDAGIIEYNIDGKEWKRTDLYTQWSSWLHLPWYLILGDELNNGSHILNLRMSDEKNVASKRSICRIRYFLVN